MRSSGTEEGEEDDYMSMSFGDAPTASTTETSLRRKARLQKEASERAHIPSKAERAAKEKEALDKALATQIDSSNKGAKMLAKMGFQGGALGRTENARTQPIEILTKTDKGGIGMDTEKKRKIREAFADGMESEKRQKVSLDEFRGRYVADQEERKAEGQMWGAMKVLEGLESSAAVDGDEEKEEKQKQKGSEETEPVGAETAKDDGGNAPRQTKPPRLSDADVLYRPLLIKRLRHERERKMRYELNNSLSNRNDDDGSDGGKHFDLRADELDDDDEVLRAFEALGFAERLLKILGRLREKHHYCFWCKYRYPDAEMDGCPGVSEDEHG